MEGVGAVGGSARGEGLVRVVAVLAQGAEELRVRVVAVLAQRTEELRAERALRVAQGARVPYVVSRLPSLNARGEVTAMLEDIGGRFHTVVIFRFEDTLIRSWDTEGVTFDSPQSISAQVAETRW